MPEPVNGALLDRKCTLRNIRRAVGRRRHVLRSPVAGTHSSAPPAAFRIASIPTCLRELRERGAYRPMRQPSQRRHTLRRRGTGADGSMWQERCWRTSGSGDME
jgi:hypothetical protein